MNESDPHAEIARLRECRDMWRLKHAQLKMHFAYSLAIACLLAAGAVWAAISLSRPSPALRLAAPPDMPREVSGTTPSFVLASVYMNGCSGTVISKGDKLAQVVSCAHCYNGYKVGDTIWTFHPDGRAVGGRLEAIDWQHDLTLWTIPADGVLATAPVPEKEPANPAYDVVGYPHGKGPNWFRLSHVPESERVKSDTGMWRWVFQVDNGKIYPGNSGCGVFVNGRLCGVVSHRNEMNDGKTLRCCALRDLLSFVKRKQRNDCGDGICVIQPPSEPPPAPPSANEPDAPPAPNGVPPAPPQNPPGAPNWKPSPNTPIVLPYDGKGPRPKDLGSDKKMASEIDKLRKAHDDRIAELERMIEELKKQVIAGPPGPPGPKGDPGPPGAGGQGAGIDKATLNSLQVADQRNAGDIASAKNDLSLLKSALDDLQKKENANEIKDQNQDVDIKRIGDQLELIDKKLSGSFRFTVRRDTAGAVSLQQPVTK